MNKILDISNEEEILLYKLQHLTKPISYHDALHISGVLRLLLHDKLIHRVNERYKLKIEFEYCLGNANPVMIYSPLIYRHPECTIEKRMIPPIEKVQLGKILSLGIYKTQKGIVTVEDIILYAANQKGGIHFQDNKQTNRNIETEKKLTTIDDWCLEGSVSYGISVTVELVCSALKGLIDKILHIYHEDVVHHYEPERNNWYIKYPLYHFKENGGGCLDYNKIYSYKSIGFFIACVIYPQRRDVILFETTVKNNSSCIRVILDSEYYLVFDIKIYRKQYIFKSKWALKYSQLLGCVISLSFGFVHNNGHLYFSAKLENIDIMNERIDNMSNFEIERFYIAKDKNGINMPDIALGEIIISKNVDFARFNELHNYLHLAKSRLPFSKFSSY